MSLRDALLKAGKVSKKQAQVAATEKRKKRKKKKGHRVEAEALRAQEQRHASRMSDQADANRERAEAARLEREAHEARMRLKNVIHTWQRKPGRRADRAFHFVRSSGAIGVTRIEGAQAWELQFGGLAIVEHPDDGAPRLVARDAVEKILRLKPGALRFYVGEGAPDDPHICPPLRPERTR